MNSGDHIPREETASQPPEIHHKTIEQTSNTKTSSSEKSSQHCPTETLQKQKCQLTNNSINKKGQIMEDPLQCKSVLGWDPIYEKKRHFLMIWLQNYCDCFRLRRETLALSQHLCDIYFFSEAYQPQHVKTILAVILVLASKFIDPRILLSSQISSIFKIPTSQFQRLELEISSKLDSQFNHFTYLNSTDFLIFKLAELTGVNLHEECLQMYLRLIKLYYLVQKVFIKYAEVSKQALFMCLKLSLKDFDTLQNQNQKVLQFFNLFQSEIDFRQQQHINLEALLFFWEDIWKEKEQKVKINFLQKKQSKNYYKYGEFVLKYFII